MAEASVAILRPVALHSLRIAPMSDDRKYVRVFHADLIRDYPDVWDDDAALSAWLRLLVVADGMWPAPAELPRSIRPRALSTLTDAGLVAMQGSHRFRIKGMDTDRNARASRARNAAALRWHSDRTAEVMPTNSEQSRTNTKGSQGVRPLGVARANGRDNPGETA